MANGITDIQFKDLGPVNPAQTDRITGQVWLNERLKGMYPLKFWRYIIDHEEGHIIGNNRSEFVADAHASKSFFERYPNQPFASVDALRLVLPMNTPEQKARVAAQTKRAAEFDCKNNGNPKSCEMVNFTGNTSNFLEGSGCKPGQYACIQAETKRKLGEEQTKQQQEAADALKYSHDLDYKKTVATLLALQQSDQNQYTLAQLNAEIELKKLDATKKEPVDSKKLLTVGLVMAAALVVVFFLMSSKDSK